MKLRKLTIANLKRDGACSSDNRDDIIQALQDENAALREGRQTPSEIKTLKEWRDKEAENERLKERVEKLEREICGFQHLADMRQCMVDAADEIERLKRAIRNCRALADHQLKRKTGNQGTEHLARNILRFCDEAGVAA